MRDFICKLSAAVQVLMVQEDGQDLIEYALLAALIALAVTASMGTVAGDINSAFTRIGTSLTSAGA